MRTKELEKPMWESYFDDATQAARDGALQVSIIARRGKIVSFARLSSTVFDIEAETLEVNYQGGKFVIRQVVAVGEHDRAGEARLVKVRDALGEEFLVDVTRPEKPSGDEDFDIVAEAGEDSFPASDPPAWSGSTVI